jgi:hypothetical protein
VQYETLDALIDVLTDVKGEQKELNTSLSDLAPLPEDIADVNEYIKEFDSEKEELEIQQIALRG